MGCGNTVGCLQRGCFKIQYMIMNFYIWTKQGVLRNWLTIWNFFWSMYSPKLADDSIQKRSYFMDGNYRGLCWVLWHIPISARRIWFARELYEKINYLNRDKTFWKRDRVKKLYKLYKDIFYTSPSVWNSWRIQQLNKKCFQYI